MISKLYKEAQRALKGLFIVAPEDVAQDIYDKVNTYIDEGRKQNEALNIELESYINDEKYLSLELENESLREENKQLNELLNDSEQIHLARIRLEWEKREQASMIRRLSNVLDELLTYSCLDKNVIGDLEMINKVEDILNTIEGANND